LSLILIHFTSNFLKPLDLNLFLFFTFTSLGRKIFITPIFLVFNQEFTFHKFTTVIKLTHAIHLSAHFLLKEFTWVNQNLIYLLCLDSWGLLDCSMMWIYDNHNLIIYFRVSILNCCFKMEVCSSLIHSIYYFFVNTLLLLHSGQRFTNKNHFSS